ncbi:hypothetical protein XELAEV_18044401mg [Xenopus laevis]|uniref:Uncharacterized protein n=1 Tax=Xenopus laevis TaxID=8355 RepID=A0A974H3C2_XENLA|nr:hypothetical protein XELAEV_18044401mg [Xenopus laevis]
MDPAQTEGMVSSVFRIRNHRHTLRRQWGKNEELKMDPTRTERKVSGTYKMKNHGWTLPRQRESRAVCTEQIY